MNLGGAPKGKRAETLHKEQVAREQADPSLRAARAQEDKAKKRNFLGLFAQPAAKRGRNEKNSGETESLNLDHMPGDDAEIFSDGTSGGRGDPAAPPLPKGLADRQEGVVYTYIHQRVERWVTTSGRHIYCTCQGGGACKGGIQIIKCKGTNDPTSTAALASPALAPRQKTEHDYAAMSTGKSASRPSDPARAMTASQQQFFESVTSIPSTSKSSGVVVMEDGMWSEKLLEHEAWSVSTQGVHFPLRIGAKWRAQGTSSLRARSQRRIKPCWPERRHLLRLRCMYASTVHGCSARRQISTSTLRSAVSRSSSKLRSRSEYRCGLVQKWLRMLCTQLQAWE